MHFQCSLVVIFGILTVVGRAEQKLLYGSYPSVLCYHLALCTDHYLTAKLLMPRRLGTWAVAKLVPGTSQIALEGPVCNGGHVLGWHSRDGRRRSRRFHVGMSGFAFNSTILWDSKRWHRPNPKPIRQLDTVKEEVQVSVLLHYCLEGFSY